ncbi:hypothetical protein ACOI1C_15270 [Bacillus sp. DJP31]|uniref:hypothetical protein n=1 Tax=Bacillus sp. DJP31 TaxID=3409789 RepID=UPI003BB516B5
MITIEELKKELENIKDKPKFHKMIEFAALLTEYFGTKGIQPIVVGGLSVEIYTRNDYSTHDIDFVSDGWELFNELLTELGFTKTQREWYHADAELAVEVPSAHLEGSIDKVLELLLPNNRKLYVIGIEDIIIHRLEGIVGKRYPKDDEDYEWAYRMFLIHKHENIDMDYLISEAKRTKVDKLITTWL